MTLDSKALKEALVNAGLEIFRTRPDELHVAERVRSHIMDSGVRVSVAPLAVLMTARAQRSDYPSVTEEFLFDRVRACVGPSALAAGFVEHEARRTEVADPSTAGRILDVWFEVVYRREHANVEALIESVRWTLSTDRTVA